MTCYKMWSCEGLKKITAGLDGRFVDGRPNYFFATTAAANAVGVVDLNMSKSLIPRGCTEKEKQQAAKTCKNKKGCGAPRCYDTIKACDLAFPDDQKKIANLAKDIGTGAECAIL